MTDRAPGRHEKQGDDIVGRRLSSAANYSVSRGQIASVSPVSRPEISYVSPADSYVRLRYESPQRQEEISAYPGVTVCSTTSGITYAFSGDSTVTSTSLPYHPYNVSSYGRPISPAAAEHRRKTDQVSISRLDDDVFESGGTLAVAAGRRQSEQFDGRETNIQQSAYSAISQHGDLIKRQSGGARQGPFIQRQHRSTSDLYSFDNSSEFHGPQGIYFTAGEPCHGEYEAQRKGRTDAGQSPRLYTTQSNRQTLEANTQGEQGSLYMSRQNPVSYGQHSFPISHDIAHSSHHIVIPTTAVATMSDNKSDRSSSPTPSTQSRRPSYLVERELGLQHLQETFQGNTSVGSTISNESTKQSQLQEKDNANTYGISQSHARQQSRYQDEKDITRTYSAPPSMDSSEYSREISKRQEYIDASVLEFHPSPARTHFQELPVYRGGTTSVQTEMDNIAAQRPLIEANVRQYLDKSVPVQYAAETNIKLDSQARKPFQRQEGIYRESTELLQGVKDTARGKAPKDTPNRPTYLGISDGQLSTKPQLMKVKIQKQTLASFSDMTPGSSRRGSFSSVVSSDFGRESELDLDESFRSQSSMDKVAAMLRQHSNQSEQPTSQSPSPRHSVQSRPYMGQSAFRPIEDSNSPIVQTDEEVFLFRDHEQNSKLNRKESGSSAKMAGEQPNVSPTFQLRTNYDRFKFRPQIQRPMSPSSPSSLQSSPKRSPSDPISVSGRSSTASPVDKLREITKNMRARSIPGFQEGITMAAVTEGIQTAPAVMETVPPQMDNKGEEDEGIGGEQTEPFVPPALKLPNLNFPQNVAKSHDSEKSESSSREVSPKQLVPGKYRSYNRKTETASDSASSASLANEQSLKGTVQTRNRRKNGSGYQQGIDPGAANGGGGGSNDLPEIRNGKGSKKKQPKSWTWPNGDPSQSDFIPVSGSRQTIQTALSEPAIPEVDQEDDAEDAVATTTASERRDYVDGDKFRIQTAELAPLSIDEERDVLEIKELDISIPLPPTKTATEKRKERLRKTKSEDRDTIEIKPPGGDKKDEKLTILHQRSASAPGTPVTHLKGKQTVVKKHVRELQLQLPTGLATNLNVPTTEQTAKKDGGLLRLDNVPSKSPTIIAKGLSATLPRTLSPKKESTVKTKKEQEHDDIKREVLNNLLDSEESYVRALDTLVKTYMKPLRSPENAGIMDPGTVDVIFYKIPEILESHRRFLLQLTVRVNNWNDKQKIGDLIISSFNKQRLMDDYLAFVDNFAQAKETFKEAKECKPSFRQFLDNCNKGSKSKFTFDDLIIQPVQRIPRYSLLIKELLKHTSSTHPDHSSLKDARKEIEKLAQTINEADRAEKNLQTLQGIDSMIEGNVDLIIPGREFLKQFPVSEMIQKGSREGPLKKDRALFLFSDLLMCTSVKRKSGRASISVFNPNLILEASKFKLLWKHHLDDVEIVKYSNLNRRASIERLVSQLEEDINVLNQIKDLTENLNQAHESLDEVVRELMESINKKLAENRLPVVMSPTLIAKEVELQATTPGGLDSHIVVFNTMDMRASWEDEFLKAKQKLADSKDTFPPQFLNPIPISKTRSGMQFSCASPAHATGLEEQREVWVCNSDGYVGQVCLLTLAPKPDVATCKTVCSARILCIAPVPGTQRVPNSRSKARPPSDSEHLSPISIEITDDDPLTLSSPPRRKKHRRAANIIAFDSDESDENASTVDKSLLHVDESVTDDISSDDDDESGYAIRRHSNGTMTGSLNELLDEEDPDNLKATMWLGTEDGCIHIYVCNDNVRTAKASKKIQHTASVQSILYLDNRVFVSLANGELVMYNRHSGTPWDFDSPQTLTIGNSNAPITKMAAVAGKLWCGRQNYIIVVDPNSFIVEQHLQMSCEQNHNVQCIVTSGLGVWISLSQQSNAVVKLYHATNYTNLADVDVTQAVHKMLAGSDAIIRQHKAACLRITALLTCKDLLWVGTSAGVVLTLPLPKITSNMSSLAETPPVTGSGHGHTGHVRFLSAVEMLHDDDGDPGSIRVAFQRRCSVSATMMPNMIVISGGDGYEDFCSTSANEAAGRDDSTNHLLLWKV
ncbi:rho guanine nucleotide exchange factor 17-like isoform X2 [Ptychodera flava]|uniref:rho guanine nucleotide exchange factor 17-like isoform X2 n=1 Tax=Ptychodera flava TaxID=63121 RepID=UPI00396A77D4